MSWFNLGLIILTLFVSGCSNNSSSNGSNEGESELVGVPGNVTVLEGNGAITVSWSATTNASSYTVFYAEESLGDPIDINDVTNLQGGTIIRDITLTSQTLSPLNNGVIYYITVIALIDEQSSLPSAEIMAVPDAAGALIITPQLDTSKRTTKIIDADGGSVQVFSNVGLLYSLELPAGALGDDTSITVTPVTAVSNLAFVDQLLAGVQFEPDGLLLSRPATLTIDLPSDSDLSKVQTIGWDGAGENVHLQFSELSSNQATFVITHFSGVAVVESSQSLETSTINAAESMESSTITLESRFSVLIALDEATERQRICLAENPNSTVPRLCPSTDEGADAIIEAVITINRLHFSDWLNAIALLAPSALNSFEDYQHVGREFFAWQAFTQQKLCSVDPGCGVFLEEVEALQEQVVADIARGLKAEFQRSSEIPDDRKISDLLVNFALLDDDFVETYETIFGVPAESSLQAFAKLQYGKQLLIDVRNFPATQIQGGDSDEFSVRLAHRKRVVDAEGNATIEETPLSGVSFTIGPKGEGCAVLAHGNIEEEDNLLTVTTDENGLVEGVSIKAAVECNSPANRSIVYLEVDDQVGSNSPYLGKVDMLETSINPNELTVDLFDFPAALHPGGEGVEFRIQLRLLSGPPLVGVQFNVGPNSQGCATLSRTASDTNSGFSDIRGFASVTTDENGEVLGLSVTAGDVCATPLDRSLIFVKVEGTDPVLSTFSVFNDLDSEFVFEAIHQTPKLTIVSGAWDIDMDARASCNVPDADCKDDPPAERERSSENLVLLENKSASVSVASEFATARASGSIQPEVSTINENGDALNVKITADLSIAGTVIASEVPDTRASSSADASVDSAITFEVLENSVSYTAEWRKNGFVAENSIGFDNCFVRLSGVFFSEGERTLNQTGTLEPGTYTLSFDCSIGLELNTRDDVTVHTNSGGATFDFSVR